MIMLVFFSLVWGGGRPCSNFLASTVSLRDAGHLYRTGPRERPPGQCKGPANSRGSEAPHKQGMPRLSGALSSP